MINENAQNFPFFGDHHLPALPLFPSATILTQLLYTALSIFLSSFLYPSLLPSSFLHFSNPVHLFWKFFSTKLFYSSPYEATVFLPHNNLGWNGPQQVKVNLTNFR